MKSKIIVLSGVFFGLFVGWYIFPFVLYTRIEQPLQFSHRTHTGEKGGMACEDCHFTDDSGRFQGIPTIAKCAECHASPLGDSESEKTLVEMYVMPNNEIQWLVYSRQPDNAYFSHAPHVTLGKVQCEECHGPHGSSDILKTYEENRISGYSRDIWGASISGISSQPWEGMKMDRCVRCHAEKGRREGCITCHK